MIRFSSSAVLTLSVLIGGACSASSSAGQNAAAPATQPAQAKPIPIKLPANAPLDPSIVNVPATTGRANLPLTDPPFAIATVGTFDAPFAMAFLPDGSLLVTEKAGHLKLRAANGGVTEDYRRTTGCAG